MDRQSKGYLPVIGFGIIFVFIDVCRQVATYGMRQLNNGKYPLSQTQIVALTESSKFILCFCVFISQNSNRKFQMSPLYIAPSLVSAVIQNLRLYAMKHVSPLIMATLGPSRFILVAFVYRAVFKKHISEKQWLAIMMLTIAVMMANVIDGFDKNTSSHQMLYVLLTLVPYLCGSVFISITLEYLYKNDNQSFSAKQAQLHLWCSFIAWIMYGMDYQSSPSTGNPLAYGLLVVVIITACLSTMAMAFIIRKLDNIVKLYTQALSDVGTSIACALIFPYNFSFSFDFLVCFVLMLFSIYLYESSDMKIFNIVKWLIPISRVGFLQPVGKA